MKKETDLPEEKRQAIRPEELRIGNLVWSVEANEPTEIFLMGIHRLLEDIRDNKPRSYRGTPLSPEWLERLGFKQGDNEVFNSSFWSIAVGGSELGINPDNGVVWIERGNNHFNNPACIDYVHQLQNLYFSLTGQELKLGGVC